MGKKKTKKEKIKMVLTIIGNEFLAFMAYATAFSIISMKIYSIEFYIGFYLFLWILLFLPGGSEPFWCQGRKC